MWSAVRDLVGDDVTSILAVATVVLGLAARLIWVSRGRR